MNEPRYVTLSNIMKAKKKPLEVEPGRAAVGHRARAALGRLQARRDVRAQVGRLETISKDEEAPIFSRVDHGLVADLFTAVPELMKAP